MPGQGSPPLNACKDRVSVIAANPTNVLVWGLVIMCAICCGSQVVLAEDVDLQLWIAWGGGSERSWKGEIRIHNEFGDRAPVGFFESYEPVGLQPDEPGSMTIRENALLVWPRRPRAYDGVRVRVRANRDSVLSVLLEAVDGAEQSRRVQVPLKKLIDDVHNSVLDDQGNQLLVRRAPGDKLRVQFQRDSLVFDPGELFEVSFDPHLISVEPNSSLVYEIQLLRARTDESLWDTQREVRVDAAGDAPDSGPVNIKMPVNEGVFDVLFTISQRRLPTRFAPSKLLYQRKLQVVVVDPRPRAAENTAWQTAGEIDPTKPPEKGSSWNVIPKLPQWSMLPGAATAPPKPIDNPRLQSRKYLHTDFVEMPPGLWQAFWLPVAAPGKPHILEIEYPSDVRQTLGISIMEPNAAGLVAPIGLDSGLDVPETLGETTASIARHRVLFWPKSKSPLVLLTNRHDSASAVFGRIRIQQGPDRMPSNALPTPEHQRLVAAYLDRPLLVENFGGTDAIDEVTGRNLNDWLSFHQGGTRLAETMNFVGYNAAMVSVLNDGSAIYPSELLQSTPKYDNGVFFGTGQDPIRKDVLELMFRVFDREGLKLIPSIDFSTPLPELEGLMQGDPRDQQRHWSSGPNSATTGATFAGNSTANRNAIDLVIPRGGRWRDADGSDRATGPYYNPLHPRVQQAMRRVVSELVRRYSHHRSFAGVAIQLGSKSYAVLPDLLYGTDFATVSEFARDAGITVPGLATGDRNAMLSFLAAEGRQRWLDWRCERLSHFYRSAAEEVSSRRPNARLYMAATRLFDDDSTKRDLLPDLPDRTQKRDLLRRVGIDPKKLGTTTVLLRPRRIAPLSNVTANAADIELNRSREIEQLFMPPSSSRGNVVWPVAGEIFFHQPQTTSLASFDKSRPFAPQSPPTWLAAQLSPAGDTARQRFVHSMATLDSQLLFDGGWLAPVVEQEELRDILKTIQKLPADRFDDVSSGDANTASTPVVVRQLAKDNRTYVYVANDSPWPMTVQLELQAADRARLELLTDRPLPPLAQTGNRTVWEVRLKPYDLVAAAINSPAARISGWHVEMDRQILIQLRDAVDGFRSRVNHLRKPEPLQVLANPGFELTKQDGVIPGWDHVRGNGTSVVIDATQGHAAPSALRISSQGPVVWIRSNPFPVPKTGRLAVWVWLKIADAKKQPPLRLAIEGRQKDGTPYYRPATVGAVVDPRSPPPPLTTNWAPYLLRVSDLPTDGLTDLRVAFDLMGAGEVWLDDVQVFDLWFDKTERNELLKKVFLANSHLGKANVTQCQQILTGYWPIYLQQHVPAAPAQMADMPDRISSSPSGSSGPTNDPTPPDDNTAEEKPWWKKVVPSTSKLPKLFR